MRLTSLPFAPPVGQLPPLANNAPAPQQFGRLLDALLVLDAEGSCRISDLAQRVGLAPQRLRELLSAFMTAGSDAIESVAPLMVSFGTAEGPLSGDEEDDDAQASADVVWLESGHGGRGWLVNELGRRPVMVKDVARALLAASLILEDDDLPRDRRLAILGLVRQLSEGLSADVHAPAAGEVHEIQQAVTSRRRLRFRYLHPWTGAASVCEVEPYDLRRQRDRLVLDAGLDGAVTAFDVAGISEVELLDGTFEPPVLPAREQRVSRVPVVLRAPKHSVVERRILNGWSGTVVGPAGPEAVDIRIDLDGDASDPAVAERLGVLLLQLGPTVSVQSPEELRQAAVPVARRLLERHEG
jgi:predicted DNA-binding transcriptional regulator YafY